MSEAKINPSVNCERDSYENKVSVKAYLRSQVKRGTRNYNTLPEKINGLCRVEVIHRRSSWKTFESVYTAVLEWIAWFNNHQPLRRIGYIPADAKANFYAAEADRYLQIAKKSVLVDLN